MIEKSKKYNYEDLEKIFEKGMEKMLEENLIEDENDEKDSFSNMMMKMYEASILLKFKSIIFKKDKK